MSRTGIVDSHVHLWDPRRLRYSWLNALPELNRPFLPPDYEAAHNGVTVEKFILVEAGCDPAFASDEVDWVSDLARQEPRLRGVVTHVALENGAAIRPALQALAANPLVKGVRRLLQAESDPGFCLRPGFLEGVAALADFDFTCDLCVRHEQLPAVTELVRRVPAVQFILDHLGKPPVRDGQMEPWRGHLAVLAALPNVACKLSGLATEADLDLWEPRQLRPYLRHALDCFGFQRLLFGSDWPVITLAADYREWFELVRETLAFASEQERNALFRANAERIYRV